MSLSLSLTMFTVSPSAESTGLLSFYPQGAILIIALQVLPNPPSMGHQRGVGRQEDGVWRRQSAREVGNMCWKWFFTGPASLTTHLHVYAKVQDEVAMVTRHLESQRPALVALTFPIFNLARVPRGNQAPLIQPLGH